MGTARKPDIDDEQFLALVAGRDFKCPGCGYDLRGAVRAECPECGRRFFPSEFRDMARMPALERMCLAGGVCVLALCGVLALALNVDPRAAPWPNAQWLPVVPAAVVVGLLIDWLTHRRRARVQQRASLALWNGVMIWLVGLFVLAFAAVLVVSA